MTGAPLGARVFDGDETFDFCCPSQAGLAQRLLEKYDRDFAGCAFDGMFLDRIRYPSLTVGAEALFGCACGECRDWLAETGCRVRCRMTLRSGSRRVCRMRIV